MRDAEASNLRFAMLALAAAMLSSAAGAQPQGWSVYGGDAAGTRYSTATEITKANVAELRIAWTYHTGDAARHGASFVRSSLEVTPVLVAGKLVFCTPFDRVIALDATNGHELWVFDPVLPANLHPADDAICRGVAVWHDATVAAEVACADRVFLGTNDARLIALDLATGKPCGGFGSNGEITLPPDVPPLYRGELHINSAPTLVNDLVVVGSAVDDMSRARAPSGTVFAFDPRTGEKRWSFDPVPRRPDDPAAASWANGSYARSAGGSVWAPMSADPPRDLIFLPTASPTAAYYGGERPGDDIYTSSVVALRASTGQVVWHYQTTHHDVWDYDVAAQPTLATLRRDDRDIPAVLIGTKMGFVFALERETGKPIFPVEERPVPTSDVPGEQLSPTQPIPLAPPPLVPQSLKPEDAWGLVYFDRIACRDRIASLRSEGLYTPPSLRGTLLFPFSGGGVNWGGGAFDPGRGLYIVNTSRIAHAVKLIPRADYAAAHAADPKVEIGRGLGTPYAARREVLLSPLGLPCNPPPWGTLAAVDMNAGSIKWQVPLGLSPYGGFIKGVPNLGGPIVTASGLVFVSAAMDNHIRAFDVENGTELWRADLPAGGQATPMTYVTGGRQYLVIAAGGHNRLGTTRGDAIIVFALPEK